MYLTRDTHGKQIPVTGTVLTPNVHTYVNRASQGHAVLDSVRAAQRLGAANLPDDGPVATCGSF